MNFRVTSDTVMNSFFIPKLGGQIYAMAGMQTKLHLIANEAGKYDGISSSYSGAGFSGMKFKAIATQDQAGFDAWVAKVKQSPKQLTTMAEFDALAKPTEYHPVEYFSSADPALFVNLINKFMGDMGHGEHKGMAHGETMDHTTMDQQTMNHDAMAHDAQMDHAGHMSMPTDDNSVKAGSRNN